MKCINFFVNISIKLLLFQAHSSVEKAGLIGLVKMRFVESDDSLTLRGAQLRKAIAIDKKQNLIPFFVSKHVLAMYETNTAAVLFCH